MSEVWFRSIGKVREGKFHARDSRRLQEAMKGLEGQAAEICIRPEQLKRNLPQNAKINVLAREIATTSGEEFERIKRLAVLEALGIEAGTAKETILGKEITIVRGTSTLTKDEASKVLDWMVDKAAFLEIKEPRWEEVEVMA